MGQATSKLKSKMPSKGVQVYTYVSAPGNVEIDIEVPKNKGTVRGKNRFEQFPYEVESSAIGWPLKQTGRFEFRVRKDNREVTRQFMDVDPVTGDVRSRSSMDDTLLETRTVLKDGLAVSYGAYEAGPGKVGLPSRHQVYISVTPDLSGWMGQVARPGSDEEKKPFNHLALPAPHDPGMNSMDTIGAILKHSGTAAAKILVTMMPSLGPAKDGIAKIIQGLSDVTVAQIAPAIIASLSMTQKDTIASLLAVGARYFEFRPAHCHSAILPHSPLPDKLYFQHGPIPGMPYDQFLTDVVMFLADHPTEIAVVHVRWDGVPAECKRPSESDLKAYLEAALVLSKGKVKAGNMEDLQKRTIAELRASAKRLLVVVNDGRVLSTYDDAANATTNGHSIKAAFEKVLQKDRQANKSMTVAQCQATPTNIKDVIYYSVATAEASTMVLMATKALCDHMLLPWLRDNAAQRCRGDQLLVVMDDFLDGAVTDVVMSICKQRLR